MAVELNEKEEYCFSAVPTAPPPPILPKKEPFTEGKNLMKSAATLIGEQEERIVKESALDVCQNILRRYKNMSEECNYISWSYHNNDVEAYLQDGPTCGLVALKLAADLLKISSSQKYYDTQELLKVAQDNHFTYHGEMFSARDMGLLAKKCYGMRFEVVSNSLDDTMKLVEHLCKGYPVLVPYDADRNYEPCLKRGHEAHWAVITGFLVGSKDQSQSATSTEDNGTSIQPFPIDEVPSANLFESKHLFLLARQGKSRHYAVWQWGDLNNSNKNLFELDQIVNDSEKTKCMLTEGVHTGLCSKVLFLFP